MSPQTPPPAPSSSSVPDLNAWSRITREVIGTPYPWVPGHVVTGPHDTTLVPHELHPAFHGALDWHSCVHMQWSLVTLLHRHGGALRYAEQQAARALLAERLTPAHLAVEVGYLRERPSFERPYGWAWAAQLVATVQELAGSSVGPARSSVESTASSIDFGDDAMVWARALAPLGEVVAGHVLNWLPRQAYPVRHGKHQNDAFALLLLLDAYSRLGRSDVVEVCRSRALD